MALNMPPSEFKPASLSDNPRHWKGDIGLMNTSNTSVVFTIESLIAFLKTHQVEVDSNLNEFKNLPKYAAFGKMEPMQASKAVNNTASTGPVANEASSAAAAVTTNQEAVIPAVVSNTGHGAVLQNHTTPLQQQAAPTANKSADVFVPTRKVREPPGGGTLTIGNLFGGDDEPVQSRRVVPNSNSVLPEGAPVQGFVPTRKVREPPGGVSTIGSILG